MAIRGQVQGDQVGVVQVGWGRVDEKQGRTHQVARWVIRIKSRKIRRGWWVVIKDDRAGSRKVSAHKVSRLDFNRVILNLISILTILKGLKVESEE